MTWAAIQADGSIAMASSSEDRSGRRVVGALRSEPLTPVTTVSDTEGPLHDEIVGSSTTGGGRRTPLPSPKPGLMASSNRSDESHRSGSLRPTVRTLEEIESQRRSRAMSQIREGPLTKKHRFLYFIKFVGFPLIIVVALAVATLTLYFGEEGYEPRASDTVRYKRQQVMAGRIVSMSASGEFVAIRDDFDFCQVYRKYHIEKEGDGENATRWEPVGQIIKPLGAIDFSADGMTIAYIGERTQRPQMREFSEDSNSWQGMSSPTVVGNHLSMDSSGMVVTVGIWDLSVDGGSKDNLASFALNGSEWVETSDRLSVENVWSFELSPTSSDLVVLRGNRNSTSTMISLFHLIDTTWVKGDVDLLFDEPILSISLAEKTFAVATRDLAQVYGYSGRKWGQPLTPQKKNATALSSVALNQNGTTLAISSIVDKTSTGVVNFYLFPSYLDTGDAWEIKDHYPTLNPLRDNRGNIAPNFGSSIAMDSLANQLLVQSGIDGYENVHFLNLIRD